MKPVTDYADTVVTAHIDAAAITHNVATIARRIAPATLMCVVKADAYGHGLATVVPAALAAGCRDFGVATIPEALQLHELFDELAARGVTGAAESRILAWLYDRETDLTPAVAAGIELALPAQWAIATVATAARQAGRTPRVHIKCDTGLGRNGFTFDQLTPALRELSALTPRTDESADGPAAASPVEIVGVMTHLARADEPGDPATGEQLETLETCIGRVRKLLELRPALGHVDALAVHASNTPGAFTLDPLPGTMARVGVGIYGLSPFVDAQAADLGLRPAMTVKSTVITVKDVPAGHGASYGFSYRAPQDTTFGLVAGGYADGLPRSASDRAQVLIGGRLYPQVGRIAMDQLIVDLGRDSGVAPGDEVIIFGDPEREYCRPGDSGGLGESAPTAADWGGWSDSINYEVVTRISPRVKRVAE